MRGERYNSQIDDKRILHLIDHMGLGGAQRIVAGMVKNNRTHFVVPLRKKENIQPDESEDRWWQPRHKSRIFFLASLLKLPKIIRKNNIEIIHSHLNAGWLTAMLFRWIWRRKDLKYVFHEHDPNELPKFIYKLFLRYVYRIGVIIAVSRAVKQRLVELGVPNNRVHLIHNYINPDIFPWEQDGIRKKYVLPNVEAGDFVVGFAGRMVARKGWKYFLQVARQSRENNIKYVMVGSGPDEKKILHWIQSQQLNEKIIFLGREKNIARFYHGLDVLFVPSVEEPMGLVQLEAQACGTPVIAFDIPGMNETINSENAILVPARDVQKAVQEIEWLKGDHEQYDALIAGGLENAKKFSLRGYMKSLAIIYGELSSGDWTG